MDTISTGGYKPSEGDTIVRPCDTEFDLYEMVDFSNFTRSKDVVCGKNPDCSRYFS